MQIPIEITFRDVPKTEEIEDLIRKKAQKLDAICDYIISCRVIVDRTQYHQKSGQPYRVRVDVTIPPGHEIVINRNQSRGNQHLDLAAEVRWAFEAAERQIIALMAKQRRNVKNHPQQHVQGVIARLFNDEGYGFIETVDGRELFFHKNSVIHNEFEVLKIGTGVNFTEEQGEKGPQASTVQIIETPRFY